MDAKGYRRLSNVVRGLANRSGKQHEQYTELMTKAFHHAQMAVRLEPTCREYRVHLLGLSRTVASVLMASDREVEAMQVYESGRRVV